MTRQTSDEHPGRARLQQWLGLVPDNFYTGNDTLQRLMRRLLEGHQSEQELEAFGAACAGPIDAAARENDRLANHPRLERFSGIGERIEEVVFHPSYHEAGREAYASGMVSCMAEPGNIRLQSALFYLLCHNGEMGHACPITCTAGLIRALQAKGSEELQARWLPGLLSPDYDNKLHASQFLTEVQGGSDVGAILAEAHPDRDIAGAWRISGEKWFCSVVDASLFLILARPAGAPEGTRGLGCFLAPRLLDDGRPNGFSIRRLKEKIGTRTMASAEIDFDGALGWPIGPLDEGFKTVVSHVLNTSRLMNALASAGAMRRAYLEALAYARARPAFGAAIIEYPLVRETLAVMRAEEAAALCSTLLLADLVDRMDLGMADEDDMLVHRFLVNANKYWTSITATTMVRHGIEILGGNGAIETFSVLPRLYRDTIVLESWEGAHNVLCMQILRDAGKLDIIPALDRQARRLLSGCQDSEGLEDLEACWEQALDRLQACAEAPETIGAVHIRRAVSGVVQCLQVLLLAEQGNWEEHLGLASDLPDAARLLYRLRLAFPYRPEEDPDYGGMVDAVLARDLPADQGNSP